MAKAQYNPSTGKAKYNPATGKAQIIIPKVLCDYCSFTPINIFVKISGIQNCGCFNDIKFEGASLPNGCYILTYDALFNITIPCLWRVRLYTAYTKGMYPLPDCTGTPVITNIDWIEIYVWRYSDEYVYVNIGRDVTGPICFWGYGTFPSGCVALTVNAGSPACGSSHFAGGTVVISEDCDVVDDWETGHSYIINSVVKYYGICYVCVLAHTSSGSNKPPNPTYWETF